MSPLVSRLMHRLYGKPLIRNVLRGELVEQMVLDALGAEWCEAGDYANWDIQHRSSGCRVQIKQSAAMQSWSQPEGPALAGRFSIAEAAGYSEHRALWDEPLARRCELYVFAWHPGYGPAADHRIPDQWEFYVVPTKALPSAQKSISLAGVRARSMVIDHIGLTRAIELVLAR